MTNCLLTKILRDNAQMFTNASTHLGTNVFSIAQKLGQRIEIKVRKTANREVFTLNCQVWDWVKGL